MRLEREDDILHLEREEDWEAAMRKGWREGGKRARRKDGGGRNKETKETREGGINEIGKEKEIEK